MKIIGISEPFTNLEEQAVAFRLSEPMEEGFHDMLIEALQQMRFLPTPEDRLIECDNDPRVLIIKNPPADDIFLENLNAAVGGAAARLKDAKQKAHRDNQRPLVNLARQFSTRLIDDQPTLLTFHRDHIVSYSVESVEKIQITLSTGQVYELMGYAYNIQAFIKKLDRADSIFIYPDSLIVTERPQIK